VPQNTITGTWSGLLEKIHRKGLKKTLVRTLEKSFVWRFHPQIGKDALPRVPILGRRSSARPTLLIHHQATKGAKEYFPRVRRLGRFIFHIPLRRSAGGAASL